MPVTRTRGTRQPRAGTTPRQSQVWAAGLGLRVGLLPPRPCGLGRASPRTVAKLSPGSGRPLLREPGSAGPQPRAALPAGQAEDGRGVGAARGVCALHQGGRGRGEGEVPRGLVVEGRCHRGERVVAARLARGSPGVRQAAQGAGIASTSEQGPPDHGALCNESMGVRADVAASRAAGSPRPHTGACPGPGGSIPSAARKTTQPPAPFCCQAPLWQRGGRREAGQQARGSCQLCEGGWCPANSEAEDGRLLPGWGRDLQGPVQ